MSVSRTRNSKIEVTSFAFRLVATLGYSTTNTLLISAYVQYVSFIHGVCSQYSVSPPWIFAAIMTVINARHAGKQVSYLVDWIQADHGACTHSDTTGERFFHQTGWWWVVIVGYIISLSTLKTAARYFSMFLMTAGYCGTYIFRPVPHRLFLSDPWPVSSHVRIYADISMGGQCHPSTTGQTVRRNRPRQRVWQPWEFVRFVFCPLQAVSGIHIAHDWTRQGGILHLESKLGPSLPSVDDHRALCARVCEFPQLRCVLLFSTQ